MSAPSPAAAASSRNAYKSSSTRFESSRMGTLPASGQAYVKYSMRPPAAPPKPPPAGTTSSHTLAASRPQQLTTRVTLFATRNS
jgi:hypothetical protein